MLQLVSRDDPTDFLDIEFVKLQLHVNGDDEDDLLEHYVQTALEYVERETGRCLVPAEWVEILPFFPRRWELQRSPITTLHEITYFDNNNVSQTLTDYYFLAGYNMPGLLYPKKFSFPLLYPYLYSTYYYPPTFPRPDAVTVSYRAGYDGGFETLPKAAIQAMLLLVGTWYQNRESEGVVTQELEAGLCRLLNQLDFRSYV